jgi:mono/diheme cytochrome c family protein
MGRVLRWLAWGGVGLLSLVAAGVAYLFVAFPKVGPTPVVHVEPSAERLARGTYLAEHVALCVDCHSERDFGRFAGPVKPGTLGKGGERFGPELGMPGTLYPPNITPYALGDWSDGELIQTLTTGATPEGHALFPLMPWQAYAKLCDDDLEALVSYVRKLEPIESEPPRSSLDFPLNLIVRTLPTARAPVASCPDRKDTRAYGEYLVRTASCADCHSPRNEQGEPLPGRGFSGGVPFPLPSGGVVRSANITPDRTGIGSWSREQFIARFAHFRDPANLPEVQAGGFNTAMPWSMYAGMSDEDLGAVYDYLRSQPPDSTPRTERFAAR